ncbi:hypothetical protein Thiowin_00488 [Thiorhodovibrio winogradskyi]|uniref:Uncharacterized protein n=1 Tax=Thiorhodovibrio winogradskyi TaxID=77007 RepID=A0ABZ0S5P3_9GAMM|nr:hypothetical protein [Thiorhodovibrio winogradskyi]
MMAVDLFAHNALHFWLFCVLVVSAASVPIGVRAESDLDATLSNREQV